MEHGPDDDFPQRVLALTAALDVEVALRRAAEARLDEAQAQLDSLLRDRGYARQARLDSNRLVAIIESSQDAIIGKTLDGRITDWNPAAQTLFGYTADEALGRPVQMLIPHERLGEEMRILADLARGVRVPPFDTRRRAKDGRLIDVSITISPIRDADGRIVGASKIARDVSAQRRAEEARVKADRLEAENRQVQEASRLKSLFLANMSHELRTPLNAIIGFADLLHAGAVKPESPKHQVFLGHIGSSGRHLLQLINDVLDLSKVESGKFEFFPEAIDLPQLVGDVRDILRSAIERKQLTLDVDIAGDLGTLVLDPARLKQVLYNFLSNAIKFTPSGGRISVRAEAADAGHVRIEVEDTGIGIEAAHLPRLFTEFQQLDNSYSKQHEGTGLGLALTRRLVEAQGGSVGVRSQPGRGTVFHAVLNTVHGADAMQRGSAPGKEGAATVHRLLVIEHDLSVQARLLGSLAAAGFRVNSAQTAEQALQHTRQDRYDAMTLGLHMPDGPGGLGLLADIRNQGASRQTPVVGMSVSADAGGVASFAIENILAKPIRTAEVLSALSRFAGLQAAGAPVLVIDDDPLALELMRGTLQAIGLKACGYLDGRQALRDIDALAPCAIVLDLMMPGFDGFAVLDALQALPRWRATPVFIWTSMLLTDAEYATLARSAQAILSKGGGALAVMLDRLRFWHPAAAASTEPGAV
jgi:PAS domain S-box-containing protein